MLVRVLKDGENIYVFGEGELDYTRLESMGEVEVLVDEKITRLVFHGPNNAAIEEVERVIDALSDEGHNIKTGVRRW